MSSFFKELIEQDNEVLLNYAEFGEYRTIIYDGVEYPHIKTLVTGDREQKRVQYTGDHLSGLYTDRTKLHCLLKDVGGVQPEKGTLIRVGEPEPDFDDPDYNPEEHEPLDIYFREYYIATSVYEEGMLRLHLEATDE